MTDTHPLWRAFHLVAPEEMAAARVGQRSHRPIAVVAPDPVWPQQLEAVRAVLVETLGERALAVSHVGSTSVPGLWAKPVIDLDPRTPARTGLSRNGRVPGLD